MSCRVIVYEKENGEKPVSDFLKSLPAKHRAKTIWEIGLLSDFGTKLKEPYTKAITGSDCKGLWELRVKFASDISRIFYFIQTGNTFILLHGFLKKTDKTPRREIETAVNYMKDYQRRAGNE